MSMKQTRKTDFNELSFWAHEPLRNGKKNMSGFGIAQFWCPRLELGWNYDVRPRCAWNRHEESDFNEFSFWAHKPLRNGTKTIQAFESLNSNVQARSRAQITILSQDEQETDAKNRTSTNLASQLTNPLALVKDTLKAFESLNFEVLARI